MEALVTIGEFSRLSHLTTKALRHYHDGRLGSHVAEHDKPLPLPIREHYLIGPNHTADPLQFRTEIWWPISAATPQPTADSPTDTTHSITDEETSPWR